MMVYFGIDYNRSQHHNYYYLVIERKRDILMKNKDAGRGKSEAIISPIFDSSFTRK
jgi:hypothetical protein